MMQKQLLFCLGWFGLFGGQSNAQMLVDHVPLAADEIEVAEGERQKATEPGHRHRDLPIPVPPPLPVATPKVRLSDEQITGALQTIAAGAGGDVLIVDCHGGFDHQTVQGAIDAAQDGDTVVVLPNTCTPEGRYFENVNFMGKAITVQSVLPCDADVVDSTIIDGSLNDLSTVNFSLSEGPDSILDGLTVTGGSGTPADLFVDKDVLLLWGGGIICNDSSPTIRNCNILSNQATRGGGIAAGGGSPVITHCLISDNLVQNEMQGSATWFGAGSGLDIENGNARLEHCTVANNIVFHGLGFPNDQGNIGAIAGAIYFFAHSGTANIEIGHCIIRGNRTFGAHPAIAPIGGGILAGSLADSEAVTLMVRNSMIVDNFAAVGGGVLMNGINATFDNCTLSGNRDLLDIQVVSQDQVITVTNSISYGNSPNPEGFYPGFGEGLTYAYSNVETSDGSVVEGEGNINADPLFIDPVGGNYHLSAASPAINVGDPDASGMGEQDIDGDPRVLEGTIDMGADEYDPDCNGNAIPDTEDIAGGASTDCNGNGIPDECGHLEADCDTNGTPDDCEIAGGSPDSNQNGTPDSCEPQVTHHVSINDPDCSNEGPGTEEAPFCNIQAAIDALHFFAGRTDVSEVVVADGVYQPENISSLGRILTLRSSNGPQNCILESADPGEPAIEYVNGESAAARLEGFTITAYQFSAVQCIRSEPTIEQCILSNNHGDAIFLDQCQSLVQHCRFTENDNGHAICAKDSDASIRNCMFNANVSSGGSAIDIHDTVLEIRNCIFNDNEATENGGAISSGNSSTMSILGCTFANNTAMRGGAVSISSGMLDIANSIFWGNSAEMGSQLRAINAGLTIRYSDSEGGLDGIFVYPEKNLIWGPGNIAIDPLFADPVNGDYHLTSASPVIDLGDPDFMVLPDETDIDGEPRVFDGDGDGTSRVDMGADEFLCAGDLNGDMTVGIVDLLDLIAEWNAMDSPADLDGDGAVGIEDLLLLIANWGLC